MRALQTAILILIILNLNLISFAQTSQDEIKIYKCKSDSTYKIKGFEIHWFAPFIDERMTLVANRKQIYLRSGHDNPNPNHLYSIQNINTDKFDKIEKSLIDSAFTQLTGLYYKKRYLNYSIDDYLPELNIHSEWTDSLISIHQKEQTATLKHDYKIKKNG